MARIMRCCGSGIGLRLQLRFDPSLGTSMWCGGRQRKGKKTKKKKKKEREREQEMVNKNETVANSINIPAFLSFSPSLITLYKVILGYMYIHICVYNYTYTNM